MEEQLSEFELSLLQFAKAFDSSMPFELLKVKAMELKGIAFRSFVEAAYKGVKDA